jgi:hypothetical protein
MHKNPVMPLLKSLILSLALCGVIATPAIAIPTLQLGANPSTYVAGGEQSVVATANPFTLYALGNTSSSKFDFAHHYFLSVAILRQDGAAISEGDQSFGSFSITGPGTSGALYFGTPPVEDVLNSTQTPDPGDLSAHGIFPTYFFEREFQFDTLKRATAYNVADNPDGFVENPAGTLAYQSWTVDLTGLGAGYRLHFDLYSEKLKYDGDQDIAYFAPFSHDAVSGPPPSVPDASGTVTLMGISLLAIAAMRRRLGRRA